MNEESTARTMLIAVGVALFCSSIVSAAVLHLRPLQAGYAALDRNRTILEAADRLPVEVTDRAIVTAFQELEARIYDTSSKAIARNVAIDAHAFDHWTAELTEQTTDSAAAVIGLEALPRYIPVYIARRDGAIDRVVLPLHGKGMWSTIHGYIALDADLTTVAAVRFHDHGETPGIGDRIQRPEWLAGWIDKRTHDRSGNVALTVSRDSNIDPANRVDVISGATITSDAVGRIVKFWLGPHGYEPLLSSLRAKEDAGQ